MLALSGEQGAATRFRSYSRVELSRRALRLRYGSHEKTMRRYVFQSLFGMVIMKN